MCDILTRRSPLRIGMMAAVLAGVAGCHASSPRATPPVAPPSPPQSPELGDASYDWHGLLIAPFGSVLKDIPLTLHEVLLFRDEARAANAADDAECYAGGTPPPRFIGRTPDEYMLCFKQERLSRVQASMRLTAVEAPGVFASACARWSQQATATSASPGAQGPDAAAHGVTACEGYDGGVHFSAHLEADPAGAQSSTHEQILSITLDSPAAP